MERRLGEGKGRGSPGPAGRTGAVQGGAPGPCPGLRDPGPAAERPLCSPPTPPPRAASLPRYLPQQETTRSRSCADLHAGEPPALPQGAITPARGEATSSSRSCHRRAPDTQPEPPSERRRKRRGGESRPRLAPPPELRPRGALAARTRPPHPPARGAMSRRRCLRRPRPPSLRPANASSSRLGSAAAAHCPAERMEAPPAAAGRSGAERGGGGGPGLGPAPPGPPRRGEAATSEGKGPKWAPRGWEGESLPPVQA